MEKEMVTVSQENAKLREIVEDLETRLNSQENRIRILENGIEECQGNNKDLNKHSNKTKIMKTSEETNLKIPTNPPERQSNSLKRSTDGRSKHPKTNPTIRESENVAFFSLLSQTHDTPSHRFVIVFDSAPTNPGSHYNRFSGMFTIPQPGTYVFTWTLYCENGGNIDTQLILNNNIIDSSYCNANGAFWHMSSTATAVATVMQGDVVFIRTHPSHPNIGRIISDEYHRTTFAGWILF
ncbi:complement C1q subcomponent subunit C-like isoform X2 [Saccostrea cucullata]|uniref:complement C1q subcomponent subunit C-like isoform X2 n=1 Tax=Saccostrea cuccullata TaxID=36930 RepID=UPI002ED48954